MEYISVVWSVPGGLCAVGTATPPYDGQKPWVIVNYLTQLRVDGFEVDFVIIPR